MGDCRGMGRALLTRLSRRPLMALFVLCLLAWLPGFFTIPALDRDESRFAQASKQMVETGDFLDIRFGETARYNKPAGIYWLQAASAAVLGKGERNDIWPYRLPSLIGAFAAVALTFWAARGFAGAEAAFFGAALLGMTVLLAVEAKIAKTDAVLLATIVAAQGIFLRAYLSARGAGNPPSLLLALTGWAALAIGILVKGPVAVFVVAASVIAVSLWDREWRWLTRLKPLIGVPLALAIVLPWFVAIGIESQGEFFARALEKDFAAKVMGGEESHGGPPGYHTALAAFTFWPATLLLIPAIVSAFKRRAEPAIRYLLVWAAVVWLGFEIAPTKLPHYVLPAFPALALLAALWFMRQRETETKSERIASVASLALFAVAGLLYAGLVALAPNHFGYGSPWWLHAGGAVVAAAVIVAAALAWRRRIFAATATALCAALILYGVAGFGTAAHLQDLWLSQRLYEAVERHKSPGEAPVVLGGYREPSMVFLLGTHTRLANGEVAANIVASRGGLVLVEKKQLPSFLETLRARGASAQALQEVDGINYSRGKRVEVTLYRVRPGAVR